MGWLPQENVTPPSGFILNELNLRARIKIKIEEKMISFDIMNRVVFYFIMSTNEKKILIVSGTSEKSRF
ncbi:MAG: hypothetical protein M1169_04925 [Firmicutes bacterium]|nr:hypothetical protein [Bacillota bacterium]